MLQRVLYFEGSPCRHNVVTMSQNKTQTLDDDMVFERLSLHCLILAQGFLNDAEILQSFWFR